MKFMNIFKWLYLFSAIIFILAWKSGLINFKWIIVYFVLPMSIVLGNSTYQDYRKGFFRLILSKARAGFKLVGLWAKIFYTVSVAAIFLTIITSLIYLIGFDKNLSSRYWQLMMGSVFFSYLTLAILRGVWVVTHWKKTNKK